MTRALVLSLLLLNACASAAPGITIAPGTVGIEELETPVASAETMADIRRSMVVEALIRGTSAHHGLLARTTERGGDEGCLGTTGMASERLQALVEHQRALLASPDLLGWIQGAPSSFSPVPHLNPLFESGPRETATSPVARLTAQLRAAAPASVATTALRSVAHLHQIALELNRDGDLLQDTFAFLTALQLPVDLTQLAVDSSGAALAAMAGRLAETPTCPSPFDVSRPAWRITLQKILNWGLKHRHVRDTAVVARELLATPEAQALAPHLQALPAQRVVIIGHSFTMPQHWSSASAFAPIAVEMMRTLNPRVSFTRLSQGGLSATAAQARFFEEARALAPQRVYLAVTTLTDADITAMTAMIRGFRAVGAETSVFDAVDIHDPYDHNAAAATRAVAAARAAGASIVAVQEAFTAFTSNLPRRYLSLDGVHMTEPYHRFMALRLLSHLVGGEVESPSVEGGRIALTFDDAPMPDGAVLTGVERSERLITALREAGVSQAIFFTNSANIPTASGAMRLGAYAAAGHLIGNHTHSHLNAAEVAVADFVANVTTAHIALNSLPGFTPFFRYPYSREGADAAAQAQIRGAVAALGYKEGYFTADAADWYWDSLLQNAARAGHADLQEAIVDLYVKATWDCIKHYALLARQVLGRDPAHVIVMHETDLNALALPALARLLKSHQWRFITASEAYADPVAALVPRGLRTQDRIRGLAEDLGVSGALSAELTDTGRIDDLMVSYGHAQP